MLPYFSLSAAEETLPVRRHSGAQCKPLNPVRPAQRVVSRSEVDSHGVPGSQMFLSVYVVKVGGNADVFDAPALDWWPQPLLYRDSSWNPILLWCIITDARLTDSSASIVSWERHQCSIRLHKGGCNLGLHAVPLVTVIHVA